MYIGAVSRLTGASAKAIRHYEALGLLPGTTRIGSYRVYGDQEIQIIRLIRQAQKLGFKLAEMKAALNQNHEIPSWQRIKDIIEDKASQIEQDITLLQKKRAQLLQYADEIDSCLQQNPDCPTYPGPESGT